MLSQIRDLVVKAQKSTMTGAQKRQFVYEKLQLDHVISYEVCLSVIDLVVSVAKDKQIHDLFISGDNECCLLSILGIK